MNLAKKLAVTAVLIVGIGSQSHATTLFSDNLQTAADLSLFASKAVGIIGTAQDGTAALTFSATEGGSNLPTTKSYSSSTGSFTVSFDYFSSCGASSGCGGFLNTSNSWVASDTSWNGIAQFSDAASWQHASYTFSGTSTNIAFEIWNGSQQAKAANANGLGASFYVKDLVLTNNAVGAANGLVITAVAEPESCAL